MEKQKAWETWRELLKGEMNTHSEVKRLAEALEVSPITLTRWASGESTPRPSHRNKLQTLLIDTLSQRDHAEAASRLILQDTDEFSALTNNPDHNELLKILIQKAKDIQKEDNFKQQIEALQSHNELEKLAHSILQTTANQHHNTQLEISPSTFPTTNISHNDDKTEFHFRIIEEPLTAQNLTAIISTLTELSTKYWLIAKDRLADLVEYTQTHNSRFAEEANVIVTKVTFNSPINMDWKVDLSAPSVATAIISTIDGITQTGKKLEKAELENRAKVQEIKQADQQHQMATIEREMKLLEVEERRLEIFEKRLEVQKKGIQDALEIANTVVDMLHPNADPSTRAMEIQLLLPNLIQLQNGKGLELALPLPLLESTNQKENTHAENEGQ